MITMPKTPIVLRFTKEIEITINDKKYIGQEISVDNYQIAAEIYRIAKEAYGPSILAKK
jgi:hypothetical protein